MKIITGKILAAHGIKGEVKVKPITDNPRRYRKGNEIYIEKNAAMATVTAVRAAKDGVLIIKFSGVEDRDDAEKLRGSLLLVEETEVPRLPEGEYYIFQLEGMEVATEDGEVLGTLAEVITGGPNDVYRVRGAADSGILIPALKKVVIAVDTQKKTMAVRLPDGLREACTYHEN